MKLQSALGIKILLISFSLVMHFSSVWAASGDSLSFSGTVVVSGSVTYKYKLVLGSAEGKWRGYSLLDEGGPEETKSAVSAQFSKQRKGMVFTERSVISSRSQEPNFCFLNAVLKLSGKNTLKGMFMGRDKQKNVCGNGTIKLSMPSNALALLTPDGTRDTLPKLVTEAISQSIRSSSRELSLELWDGGNVDQDSLSVIVNDRVLAGPFAIASEKRRIVIRLDRGVNTIKIKAHNEGAQAPNSARMSLHDGRQQYTLVSYLKSGEEATIKVHCK